MGKKVSKLFLKRIINLNFFSPLVFSNDWPVLAGIIHLPSHLTKTKSQSEAENEPGNFQAEQLL